MEQVRNIRKADFNKLTNNRAKIEFLLRYAILAPSTHNSQPWLFKIESDGCQIYYNKNLKIPLADPENRDLFISIGCCIENLVIAAKYFGVFGSLNYKLNNNLVAEVNFNFDNPKIEYNLEPLLNTILNRINARGIFSKEPVSIDLQKDTLSSIQEYTDGFDVKFLNEPSQINELADITSEGLRIAYKNPKFRKEMAGWFRNSFTRKKDGLPGYALKMPALISIFFSTLVKMKDIGPKLALLNSKSIISAPSACIISADESANKALTWVKTGRLAQRLMLEFNSKEFNTSIFVASIEMGDLYKKVQQLIKTSLRPQFVFVIGKIDYLHKATPRHDISSRIIN